MTFAHHPILIESTILYLISRTTVTSLRINAAKRIICVSITGLLFERERKHTTRGETKYSVKLRQDINYQHYLQVVEKYIEYVILKHMSHDMKHVPDNFQDTYIHKTYALGIICSMHRVSFIMFCDNLDISEDDF